MFRLSHPPRVRSPRLRAVPGIVLLWLIGMGAVPAQELDVEDFEARADYGYYTEDATGLRNLIRDARASLEKGGDVEGAHYALAFAQYRLGQVLAPKDQAAAAVAMASCIDEFGKTPESGASAEDNVLQAACHGQLAQLRTLTALLNSRLTVTRLEKARKLDARNPRLALIDAQEALRRGDKASALIRLKTATTLFEAAESARFAHAWGQADAWALLGSGLLEKGDTLAARSAIERALLIAPEYAMARRLLTRVSAPAR